MPRQVGKVLACGLTIAVGAAAPAWAQRATERVSVSSGGDQGNGPSSNGSRSVALSANGRLAAFGSAASNLVPNDTNGHNDVFVRVLAP